MCKMHFVMRKKIFRYVHDVTFGHVLKKLKFFFFGGGGGGVCGQNICYYIGVVRDSLKFDMHHSHVLKKLNFNLLTPSPRVVAG